jgi:hypothetical protein
MIISGPGDAHLQTTKAQTTTIEALNPWNVDLDLIQVGIPISGIPMNQTGWHVFWFIPICVFWRPVWKFSAAVSQRGIRTQRSMAQPFIFTHSLGGPL